MSFEERERINLKSRFVQTVYTLSCDYIDLLVLDADSLQVHHQTENSPEINNLKKLLKKFFGFAPADYILHEN